MNNHISSPFCTRVPCVNIPMVSGPLVVPTIMPTLFDEMVRLKKSPSPTFTRLNNPSTGFSPAKTATFSGSRLFTSAVLGSLRIAAKCASLLPLCVTQTITRVERRETAALVADTQAAGCSTIESHNHCHSIRSFLRFEVS